MAHTSPNANPREGWPGDPPQANRETESGFSRRLHILITRHGIERQRFLRLRKTVRVQAWLGRSPLQLQRQGLPPAKGVAL